MERRVVVVDGMRTAFGRNGGSLRGLYTTDLCAKVMQGLLKKQTSSTEGKWMQFSLEAHSMMSTVTTLPATPRSVQAFPMRHQRRF